MEKIIRALTKRADSRSSSERSALYTYFSNFNFFHDVQANDESGATFRQCVDSLSIETHSSSTLLNPALYFILKGSLIVDSIDLDTFQTTHKKSAKLINSKPQENFIIEAGSVFGHIPRPKTYNIIIKEPCTLAILHSVVYEDIIEKQEILLLEKIDLLKNLEIFRNWSRKALNTAARAFDKLLFRKGEIVYREGENPDSVFIVASGEFKLSQAYYTGDEIQDNYEFGSISFLKGRRLKETSHISELQLVIKQQDDIFGFSEILEGKAKRELTCVCHSKRGELLSISEKEFNKKFSHPETLRNLQEQNTVTQKWASRRLLNLQNVEKFKAKLSHTPKSLMKMPRKDLTPRKKDLSHPASLSPTPKLPRIFMNILYNPRNNYREKSFVLFPTELNSSHLHY